MISSDGHTNFIGLALCFVLAAILIKLVLFRQRLPNVPYLRLSTLPGAAGIAADIAAYVKDGAGVMQTGWEMV